MRQTPDTGPQKRYANRNTLWWRRQNRENFCTSLQEKSDNTRVTIGSRKSGVFIKTADHENDNDNNDKNNNDGNNNKNNSNNNIYNNNDGIIIQLWISLTQWMSRTEIHLYIIALWVNICLESAVKPINTFYFHFAEHRTSRFNNHLFWVTLGGEVHWGVYTF